MVDPTGNNAWLRGFAERAAYACKRIVCSNWESYGKLGDAQTWLISIAVFVALLLISFLTFR